MTAINTNNRVSNRPVFSAFSPGDELHRRVVPGQPVRVALVTADDHVRLVVAQELSQDARTEFVAQASSLRDGRRLLTHVLFDVLLVDLVLADGNGLELLADLKARGGEAETVVMSSTDDDEQALHALCMGAAGWMVRTAWLGSFTQVVLQVASGGTAMSHSLAKHLLRNVMSAHAGIQTAPPGDGLSGRQAQVLRMMAAGHSTREIGNQLAISSSTVNAHVKSIYSKLGVHSRAQVVRIAAKMGLIE